MFNTINARICKDGSVYVEVNGDDPETVISKLKATYDAARRMFPDAKFSGYGDEVDQVTATPRYRKR
jgi:acylphosphatase